MSMMRDQMSSQMESSSMPGSSSGMSMTGPGMSTMEMTDMESRRQQIAMLAYSLWQARGCPEGSSEQDWLQAEQQITSGMMSRAASA